MLEGKLKYATQNLFLIDKEEHIIGDYLYDKNKELIGKIEGLVVELPKHNIKFLSITQGGFLNIQGKKILVPRQACEIKDIGKVITSFSKHTIQDAPSPHDLFNLTKSEELLIMSYFGLR
jgi:hypothetical protein